MARETDGFKIVARGMTNAAIAAQGSAKMAA
jgi:hypothetical protein